MREELIENAEEALDGDAEGPVGSLSSLARLAADSGGEFTERTNDLARGVVHAKRDLACVYSLGFYEDDIEDGRIRDLIVRVRRPGVRVSHPFKLAQRSAATRRESLIRAGFLSDASGSLPVQARIVPLRPRSGKVWDGVVAITFDLSADDAPGDKLEREFGGVLYNGPSVSHQFDRQIKVARSAVNGERRVTFMEPVQIKPGRHTLSVVVSDPATQRDLQARASIEVPDVPRDELFVVDPILGRRAGGDIVLTSNASADGSDAVGRKSSFQPLVGKVEGDESLVALTQICRYASKKRSAGSENGAQSVRRELLAADGAVLGTLPEVPLALEGEGKLRCQNLLDLLPSESLDAGSYVFRASVDAAAAEATFEVARP